MQGVRLQILVLFSSGGCSALLGLSEDLGALASLQKLDLFGCTALQALPSSMGGLQSLLELDVTNCTGLSHLAESLGALISNGNTVGIIDTGAFGA